jgi:hypothetical protein
MTTMRSAPDPTRVLNFTTTITVDKTVGEIQRILVAHDATMISMRFDDDRQVEAIEFHLRLDSVERAFRLSANWRMVRMRLIAHHNKGKRSYTRGFWTERSLPAGLDDQARRTSWRILKDAVEVMLNLADAGIADTGQILFGFAMLDSGVTIYDAFKENQRALPDGVS